MLDTTPITTEIIRLITAGTTEGEIIARVVATAAAERRALRAH
jgi:hypothetical protein